MKNKAGRPTPVGVERVVGCDFSDAGLVKKYGTWFRVQVAFYDFLFTSAMDLCTHHCNEAIAADFAETSDPYKRMREAVEKKYPAMPDAWRAFVTANAGGETRRKPEGDL